MDGTSIVALSDSEGDEASSTLTGVADLDEDVDDRHVGESPMSGTFTSTVPPAAAAAGVCGHGRRCGAGAAGALRCSGAGFPAG